MKEIVKINIINEKIEELGLNFHSKNLSKLFKLLKLEQKAFLKRKNQPSLIITIITIV